MMARPLLFRLLPCFLNAVYCARMPSSELRMFFRASNPTSRVLPVVSPAQIAGASSDLPSLSMSKPPSVSILTTRSGAPSVALLIAQAAH